MEKFTAIVLAGGTGKRMHSHIHKQYLTLAGKPVLYYALKAFERVISQISSLSQVPMRKRIVNGKLLINIISVK